MSGCQHFIGKLLITIGILVVGMGCQKAVKSPPNIIFFLVDDQRNNMLSCEGHPVVETPAVDRLAEHGVLFNNAFVTTSICAASRASILTGMYETAHSYTFGTAPLRKEYVQQSYPALLKENGYITAFTGKLGVNIEYPDSLLQEMFDFYRPSGKNYPHFIMMPDSSFRHSAEVRGEDAIEFLSLQHPDQPFCLSISFNAVHAVDHDKTPGNEGHYPYPASVANLYEGITMPLPELDDPEIFENHPDFLKNSLNRERYFWRWDTPEKYQVNMTAYYRMITGYDRVIGRILGYLKEKGLAENTVIIFSADNGYYMGERGFAGKWSHYEESLRVPLIISDPRNPSLHGGRSDALAVNLDIPSTILELAGVEIPETYQGTSLLPATLDPDHELRQMFLIEHRMDHEKIPKFTGMRSKRYVYANYYEEEPPYKFFHDLEKDPDQLINFISDTAYLNTLDGLLGVQDSLVHAVKSSRFVRR